MVISFTNIQILFYAPRGFEITARSKLSSQLIHGNPPMFAESPEFNFAYVHILTFLRSLEMTPKSWQRDCLH